MDNHSINPESETESYVNLGEVANQFNKRFGNWIRLKRTQDLLEEFRQNPNYDGLEPIITKRGRAKGSKLGNEYLNGGTWAHPFIAYEFERWCKLLPPSSSTCVYLISAVGSSMIKIGIAKDPASRLKQMQINSPLKLVISRYCPCENPDLLEKELHKAFEEYHSHGEWFKVGLKVGIELFEEIVEKWN